MVVQIQLAIYQAIPEWFNEKIENYKSAYNAFKSEMDGVKDVDGQQFTGGQGLADEDSNFFKAIDKGYEVLTALEDLNNMLDGNSGSEVMQNASEAFKGASDLFSSALAFVDPNSYGTFAAASQSKGSSGDIGGSAPGGGSVTGAVGGTSAAAVNGAGAVMVNDVNSISKVEIGSDAVITSSRDVNIGAENLMEDVSLGGLNLGLFNNAGGGTAASIGATVNYAEFDTDTIIAINDGAAITGGNIDIDAQNIIDHVSVAASAGKGPSAQTETSGVLLNGMLSFVNGSSDILTVVDDGAKLTAEQNEYKETVEGKEETKKTEGNISITGHNNTNITNVAAGASWGKGSAAVGVGLAYTDFDVKNITGVADVAEQVKRLYTYKEHDTDANGEDVVRYIVDEEKVKEFEEELDNKYSEEKSMDTDRGITAYDFTVDAATDGSIQSVSAAGSLSNDDASGQIGFFDKIGSGLNSLDQKLVGEGGLVDKASSALVGGGKNGAEANELINLGTQTHGGSGGINIVGGGSSGNVNTFMPSFSLAGSGSVSINMLDNATEAIVDNAKIKINQAIGKEKGDITVTARDALYAGAYSGAAALQWNAGGSSGDTSVSVSGAAGVNDIDNDVKATIRNSTISGAGKVDTMALSGGEQLALGLGMAVVKADGTTGYSGNAAVSVNLIDHDVEALQENNTVINTDDVNVYAYARDLENTGGGTFSGGQQKIGGGVTVGVAQLHNNISAGIKGGTYTDVESVDVQALNALQNITVGVAAGVTVPSGDGSSANVQGAGVYNEVHNTTNAFISGSDKEHKTEIITKDGGIVNVVAQDTAENSDLELRLAGLDDGRETLIKIFGDENGLTGKNYFEGIDTSAAGEEINLDKNSGSSIVTVSTSVSGTKGDAGVGVAAAITDIENNYTANIEYADITTEKLTADAGSDSNIVTVAGGVAVAGKGSGVGSVSWNDVENTAKVNIDNSVIKAQETEATAENTAQIVSVTGQISGGKKAAVGAALGYVGLDNSTEANITNTTFNKRDTNENDGITVTADAQNYSDSYNIGAGVSAAGDAAVSGTVVVTQTHGTAGAVMDTVTIDNAKKVTANALDDTDILSVIGTVTIAGKAAVGAGVAYTEIDDVSTNTDKGQYVTAEIKNNSIINTDEDEENAAVSVTAKDTARVINVAVGVGGSGKVAVQGASATTLINKTTSAEIADTKIDEEGGTSANVTVDAQSDSEITSSASTAAVAGQGAGVGAGIAVNRIIQQTNAAVNGGTMNINNLTVKADAAPRIENIGIGVAAAAEGAGVTGSVAVNMIQNDVTAHIGSGATIVADGSVGVVATSDEQIANYAGQAAVGGVGAGVGVSVSVNQIAGTTSATVGGEDEAETNVTAKGNDSIKTNTKIDVDKEINNALIDDKTVAMDAVIDRQKEDRSGLIVDASSTRDLKSFLITAGVAGEGAGVAGTVNVNQIAGSTDAGITNTNVNANITEAGNVTVNAGDYSNMSGFVGSVGAGAAGIGGGAAGVVTVTELNNTTQTILNNSKVNAGTVNIKANHTGIVNAGNVSVGGAGLGVGGGLSVGVLKDNSTTAVTVKGDNPEEDTITASGDVTIAAANTATVNPMISANGVGAFGGIAGATSINNLNSKVVTTIESVGITSAGGSISGTADNTFNVKAYMGTIGGGAVGVGAGVTVNTIDSTVQTNVNGSILDAAKDITLTADETRDIEQTATNVAVGSAGAVGANIAVTTVGKEIADGETKEKVSEANNVFGDNAGLLTAGAASALATAGIENYTPHVDAELGGGKDSQITVNISGSKLIAGNTVKAKATETDDINMTLGSGVAGQAAVNAGVGILDVNRNVGVNITGGGITADTIEIGTDIDGAAKLEVYQGTAGLYGTNAAVGKVHTTGNSKIDMDDVILAGNTINVTAGDHSAADVNVLGITVGAVSVGAIEATAENEGSTEVEITNSESAGKDEDANGSITISTDKANTVAAHATGGTGGVVSGSGVVATASDSGASKISLGAENGQGSNAFIMHDINIAASAKPAVTAIADSVSVSFAGTAGASVATASADGSVQVNVYDGNTLAADTVDITADAGTQEGKNTAEAKVEGNSGGGYAAVAANAATATTNMKVDVTIGDVAYKEKEVETITGYTYEMSKDEDGNDILIQKPQTKQTRVGATALHIGASNASKTVADARGVTIGLGFSSGNNIAKTENTSATNITLKGGNEATLLGSLDIAAAGAGDNKATADGSGGGLVGADFAAVVDNAMDSDVTVNVTGSLKVNGDVSIEALQSDTANINADALKATVVGLSGTKAENTIGGETKINLGADIDGSGSLDVNAANTITFGNTEEYAVEGSGYGGINAQGADFTNSIEKTANINVTGNQIVTAGAQTYEAKTTGDITAGGYIKAAGLGSFTWVTLDNDLAVHDSITVGSDSFLKTTEAESDIVLAAVDNVDVTVRGVADVQGAAVGGASSDVANTLTRDNAVMVNGDVYSMNDVSLFAGKDKIGNDGKLNVNVESETYNYAGIPLAASPKLSDHITQSNRVVVGNESDISSVRNIDLYADAGKETIRDTTLLYTWVYSDKNEGYTSSTIGDKEADNKTSDNYVQVDGALTAGVQNKQYITIGGTYNPETGETTGSQLVFFNPEVLEQVQAYGNGQESAVDMDGVIITGSGNVTKDDIVFETFDYGLALFERYNELGELMNSYGEDKDSTAYLGYQAERQRIFQQLSDMHLLEEMKDADGNVVTDEQGNTRYVPVEGAAKIDSIALPDIIASGGNINIQTDNLTGSGELTAQGSPEVVINNNTNLYLKVNDVIVGDAGGEINYNSVNITSDGAVSQIQSINADAEKKAAFSSVVADAGDGQSKLVINGNYGGEDVEPVYAKVPGEGKEEVITTLPRADIEINGNVSNANGLVEITSKANNIVIQGENAASSAGVTGKEVHLTAAGSISQGFQEGIVNIGGSVQEQYGDQYDALKDYFNNKYAESIGNPPIDGDVDQTHVKEEHEIKDGEKEEDLSGNRISGENIYISASDININGAIQSGYADYILDISGENLTDVQNKIEQIQKNWQQNGGEALSDAMVTTGDTYKIVVGGNRLENGAYVRYVDAYYNPSTGKIVVPDVDANGGKVYLTGRISSTGGGSIKVLDGAYDITVTNDTGVDLQLGKLVSNDVEGLISITDTAKNTVTEITRDKTVYKDLNVWDAATGDWKIKGSEGPALTTYTPEEGLRYNWTTGQNLAVSKTYRHTVKAGLWGLVEVVDDKHLQLYEEKTEPIKYSDEASDKLNGEYVGNIDGINEDFVVIFDNKVLTNTVSGPDEPKRWSSGFLGWFKWEEYTWPRNTGTSQQYVASVKADNPIDIGFIGNADGHSTIGVTSKGSVDLTGTIGSANGGTDSLISIKTDGSINQLGGTLNGDNIDLTAQMGMNDIDITSIGDDVALKAVNAGSGDVTITVNGAYGKAGNVILDSVTTTSGAVSLTADGNITQKGTNVSVSADRIDLVSHNGSVGTDGQALIVHGGQQVTDSLNSLSASVNVSANGNINLTQESGDLRIGRIYSETGDVMITVNDGDLVDALPDGEVVDRGNTDELIQKWEDLGLIQGEGENNYTAKIEQDVADYEASIEEEFNHYKEMKDYYDGDSLGEVSQVYKDAYEAYSEAKVQYDSLKKEYDVYQKGQTYYVDSNRPQKEQYKTEEAWQNALAEFEQGKELFEAAKEKFESYDSVGAYMEATSPDAYNAYMKPSVTVTETAQDGTMVQNTLDMKSAFDGYAAYEALAETYGNYTSAEDYLKHNDDAQVHIAELQEAGKEYWNKEQLLYAISDNILNPDISETDKVVKDPNLKGNNITVVVHGGSAGLNSDTTKVIGVSDLTDVANLQALANASASNVTWDAAKEEFTITDKLPLGIQSSGAIHIETDGNAYLAGRTEDNAAIENQLNIDLINANDGKGNITLQGHDGIYNVHEGDDAAIIGNDLVIQGGENGSIGTDERMMNVVLNGTLQAQSKGSIYVKQLGGDLELVSVGAGEDIVLQASGSIVNSGVTLAGGAEGQITSEGQGIISLVAGGGIGSADDGLNIEANGAVVNAQAESDIYLSGSGDGGTLVWGTISGENLNVYNEKGSVALGRTDDEGEDVEVVEGSIATAGDAVITAKDNIELSDGTISVNAGAGELTLTAENGSVTQNASLEGSDTGIYAATVNVSSKGSQLLENANNVVTNFVVHGLEENNSLTGDVHLVSNAGTVNIDFSDDEDNGITVNNDSIDVYHTGANGLNVTGSATTKSDGSKEADINFQSEQSAIHVDGTMTAEDNFSATTTSGAIEVTGTVTANTGNVTATTGSGNVTFGGSITANDGEVKAETGSGDIYVTGGISSGKDTLLKTENLTEDDKGNISIGGQIVSGKDVIASAQNGDITFTGDVTANNSSGNGGNITANIAGTGDINVHHNITADMDVNLNTNSGNILFEGTQDGVHEDLYVTSNGGDVTVSINSGGSGVIKDTNSEGATGDWAHLIAAEGNVTVKHDGVGDVDLYELYAKQDAGVSVADGKLHLVNVSGNLVAVFVKSEGKDMDVENIEAAQQIAISGSNMDLDSITQREDGDGFLVITPEGTADDQPIDNLVIGDILTNGGVRFDHLWLNTGNIHVSEGALHLDKVYVQDKATFSTNDMTTNVFGSAPVYDDSVSSSYWVNTSINSPKDDLAAWNSDELNDKWMHIFFLPEGSVQISNGNLLHLADHNYAYNQRYSQVNWMNIFTDEDFYNFYDKYYAPDLSYHERYGLTSGDGYSVENAEEDEVIVE